MTLNTLSRCICSSILVLILYGCQSATIQTNARSQVSKPVVQPKVVDKPITEPEVDKPVVETDPKHNKINKPDAAVVSPADLYKRKADDIRIVLTFDDGPHATNDHNSSLTMRIAKTLQDGKRNGVQHNIKAAFFMQMGVSYRGGSDAGLKVLAALNKSGHVIAVHTGSSDGSRVRFEDRAQRETNRHP